MVNNDYSKELEEHVRQHAAIVDYYEPKIKTANLEKCNFVNWKINTLLGRHFSMSQDDYFHFYNSCDSVITSMPNLSSNGKDIGKTYSKDDIDVMSSSPGKEGLELTYHHEVKGVSPKPSEQCGAELTRLREKLESNLKLQNESTELRVTKDALCKCSSQDSNTKENEQSCLQNPCSLNAALENIPIAYNPVTKSLEIQVHSPSTTSSNSSDGKVLEPERSHSHKSELKLCKSSSCILDRTERQSDSRSNSLQRIGTNVSLCRTDASSSLSISSLSTDYSLSAASATDDILDVCGNFFDYEGPFEVSLHPRKTYDHSRSSSMSSGRSDIYAEEMKSFGGQGVKPKRRGLTGFLTRSLFGRGKTKEDSQNAPGWKLFGSGKPPPKSPSPLLGSELESSNVRDTACSTSPSPARKCDIIPPSSNLILESRPAYLPAKKPEEQLKHKQEYEEMLALAKKRDIKESKLRKRLLQRQMKQESFLSQSTKYWNERILPNWETTKSSRKVRELWWQGLPPSVRGKLWKLAIGNDLNITPELYLICVQRAQEKLQTASNEETGSSNNESPSPEGSPTSRENSVELIRLDVSRTFPGLCIFQKGGPYHDLLQNLLGAYACYRPDVGYVQGMSFVAAMLLLNVDVDDAFICFANLLNKPCHLAFFRMDDGLMKAYFNTYEEIFAENLPKLFDHFAKHSLTPDLYLIDWVYTIFSKSLPLDIASRVWDLFCRDGEEFLFRCALGVLRMYEDILINLDFIHVAQFLTKLPEDMCSELLFKNIESIKMHVEKRKFAQVLSAHVEMLKDKSKES